MSPRKPYPRWERDPGRPGCLVYRAHPGPINGVVGGIDRRDGPPRSFVARVGGYGIGSFVSLRSAKAEVELRVHARLATEKLP